MRSRAHFLPALIAVCLGTGAQAQTPVPPPVTAPDTQQPVPAPKPAPPAQTPGRAPSTTPGQTIDPIKDPGAPETPDANAVPTDTDQLSDPNGQPAGGEYTGPSVLSRGFNFARPVLPTQARFRPFAQVNFNYSGGLTAPTVGAGGQVQSDDSAGLDAGFGISGRRYLRKQVFDLDYRGHLYYYASNHTYSSQDHSLSAGYTRYLTSHLLVSFHENAGLYSNNYSILGTTSTSDVSLANVSLVVNPNTETFDSKTYFTTSEVDAVFQKSGRLSFNIGAAYFAVNRSSASLVNAKGSQARSDAVYRVTKRTTVGTYYAYSHFDFSHVYGDSNVHTTGFDYSLALTKTLSLKLRGGVSRVEVQGLRSVTLDPVIVAILGVSTGIERYYTVTYSPDFSGTLNKSFAHSSYGASVSIGVSPGNGLYLTSRHESENLTYTYSGIRNYAFALSLGRDKLLSIGDIVGSYSSYSVGANASRPFRHGLHATFTTDYRHLGLSLSGYGRSEYRVSFGVAYSPGEGPLKFW